MASTRQHDRFPEAIGPYRIEKELGKGGMGTVYRAFHQTLARPVALKCIHPEGAHRATLRERLLREARASARISHPNIVHVYDVLEHGGKHWIVMELAAGVTLDQLLLDGPLAVDRGLSIARDVARGLAAAHGRNIIHRDLKTENVVVGGSGVAKILDFGLAKIQDLKDGLELSVEGRILGTARAMSPEQAEGEPLDHRSDLFSFGTLLYEMLSGKSPFRRATMVGTLLRVATHEQVPLNLLNPEVPEELSQLVDRLLEKDPGRRPQSADEVLLALERLSSRADSGPVKILFVDDEPDFERLVRLRYRRELRSGQLDLAFAGDGLEALAKLRADPGIHLVMADINMPRMDGLTLLDEVRGIERTVLTIMVSAYGDMTNIRRAMNLGAFDFVTKPIDFKDLDLTRDKALEALAKLREIDVLRNQNLALEEHNRLIRAAIGRDLRGGGSWAEEGASVEVTLVQVGLGLATRGGEASRRWGRMRQVTVDLLFRHGGLLASWDAGDGAEQESTLVAVFGLPMPRRQDPHHAIAWVEALQLAAEELGVGLRAGLDAGEVVWTRRAEGDGLVPAGPAASRVASLYRRSGPGQVLITPETAHLGELPDVEASRLLELRNEGSGEPLRARDLNETSY